MCEPAIRDRQPYNPDDDKRTDRIKRGRCGRAYCYEPAAWVWTDAKGSTRHECNRHAGLPNHLEDSDERVREGLRRENNGLTTQRLAAIQARNPRTARRWDWHVVRDAAAVPVGIVWGQTVSRI